MRHKTNQRSITAPYSKAEDDLAQLITGERSGNLITHEFHSIQSRALWNEVTNENNYYITQNEIDIIPHVVSKIGQFDHFVDLGPGNDASALAKALPLIDATRSKFYRPVDITSDFALQACHAIKKRRDHIDALPIIGDWEEYALNQVPHGSLVYYSGVSACNVPLYNGEKASDGLQRHFRFLKQKMNNVSLLVTVDVNHDRKSLELSYNAPMMRRFNHALWQTFETSNAVNGLSSDHIDVRSEWNAAHMRVSHIAKAKKDMHFCLNGYPYTWRKGDELTQSHSIKPTQNQFTSFAHKAGWNVDHIFDQKDNTLKIFLLS